MGSMMSGIRDKIDEYLFLCDQYNEKPVKCRDARMVEIEDISSVHFKWLQERQRADNLAKAKGEINTNTRLFDLVRYMRAELHDAELITDDEYSWLLHECPMAQGGGSPSPRRLESYDEISEKLQAAYNRIDQLESERDALRDEQRQIYAQLGVTEFSEIEQLTMRTNLPQLAMDKARLLGVLEYFVAHVGPVPLRKTASDILREHKLRDRMVLIAKAAIDAAKSPS